MSHFEQMDISNVAGDQINPATEEKQNDLIDLMTLSALEATQLLIKTAVQQLLFDTNGALLTSSAIVDPLDITRRGEFDNYFHAPLGVEMSHHEVHEGDMFSVSLYDSSVASGEYVEIYILTPPVASPQKRCHIVMEYQTGDLFTTEIKEGLTRSSGGTLASPQNRNRGSSKTSSVVVYTGVAGGVIAYAGTPTTIYSWGGGIKDRQGGNARAVEEWVLAPNTGYQFKITSNASGNKISLGIIWYEHTDE